MNTSTSLSGKTKTASILGLTSYEKKILEATAKFPLSISLLAVRTNIPRTSLLYILNNLAKRNLVKKVPCGKRVHWKSTTDTSVRHVNLFPLTLEEVPGQTKEKINYDQVGIVTYSGRKALFGIFEDLANLPPGSRVYGIQPDNSIKYSLRKNATADWLRINNVIKEKKFVIEAIVHEKSVNTIVAEIGKEKAVSIFDSFVGRLEDYVKIPDEFADVESELYIFGGHAYLINWNNEVGIGIHDKHMVELLLALFSCTKELGTRYSQNQKMESYRKILKKK